ncbi:hypothetical protein P5V15_001182 [Pogonomyrmex californicus]
MRNIMEGMSDLDKRTFASASGAKPKNNASPAESQKRYKSLIIRKEKIIVYIADILIPSESVEQNLALTSSPILALYNPAAETELHMDASHWGLGAILLQKQRNGNWAATASIYFS